jgi:hypothetical protein
MLNAEWSLMGLPSQGLVQKGGNHPPLAWMGQTMGGGEVHGQVRNIGGHPPQSPCPHTFLLGSQPAGWVGKGV